MPVCNILAGATVSIAARRVSMNAGKAFVSMANISPGLVQNCPIPNVMDAAYCCASAAPFCAMASGRNTTGLVLPISEKTGMGFSRAMA